MNKIEPGQVFRVSLEKRTPRENESFVVPDGDGIGTSEHDRGHGERYILEPIDASRVTIAEEPKPLEPKWKVVDAGHSWRVDMGSVSSDLAFHIDIGKCTFSDARERARALCDELNERDAPKPRYEVLENEFGEQLINDREQKETAVFPRTLRKNRALADELCAVFNRHAKN